MAAIDNLQPNDVVGRYADGLLYVTRDHGDSVSTIPMTFDSPQDFFEWLERHADRLSHLFDPAEIRKTTAVLLQKFESQ